MTDSSDNEEVVTIAKDGISLAWTKGGNLRVIQWGMNHQEVEVDFDDIEDVAAAMVAFIKTHPYANR